MRSTFFQQHAEAVFIKWSIYTRCTVHRVCQVDSKEGENRNYGYGYELLLCVAYANEPLSSSFPLADILFRAKRISYRESKQHFISRSGLERFLVCVITRRRLRGK